MQTEPAFPSIRQWKKNQEGKEKEWGREREGGSKREKETVEKGGAQKMALTVNPIGFCEN